MAETLHEMAVRMVKGEDCQLAMLAQGIGPNDIVERLRAANDRIVQLERGQSERWCQKGGGSV